MAGLALSGGLAACSNDGGTTGPDGGPPITETALPQYQAYEDVTPDTWQGRSAPRSTSS